MGDRPQVLEQQGPVDKASETCFQALRIKAPKRYMGKLVHQHEIMKYFHSQIPWRNHKSELAREAVFFKFKEKKDCKSEEL